MKLRNKKTGIIIDAESCNNTGGCISIFYEEEDGGIGSKDCYSSLAELNEEWEDCEEPKEYWYIGDDGTVYKREWEETGQTEFREEIGNYFESKEEAEKAVEKLKAWRRLRDKGFEFREVDNYWLTIKYSFDNCNKDDVEQIDKDLDLLFGGGE